MQQYAVHSRGCSEVHFGTLSSEIEHRKVVKKLIFKGPIFSLQGQ